MATPSQYNANLGYDMPGSGKCVMEYAMRLFAVRSAPRGVNCNVVIPGIDSIYAFEACSCIHAQNRETATLPAHHRMQASPRATRGASSPGRAAWARTSSSRPSPGGWRRWDRWSRVSLDAVAFLCSPQGRLITGVSLPVDGGVHLKT